MLGTAYIMKKYTEANTAMEIHIYMLLLQVWGKMNNKLFPHLHFVFLWHFLELFLCDTARQQSSIPGVGSAFGYGYLAFIYIKRS